MKRGIVFTVDAVLALVAAAAFITLLYSVRAPTYDETAFLRLQQLSSGSLNALEKDGSLPGTFSQSDAQASAALEAFLAQGMPNGTQARIKVEWYRYKAHGNCGSCNLDGNLPFNKFCRCRAFNTSGAVGNITTSTEKRMFYKQSGDDHYLGLAQMDSWLK